MPTETLTAKLRFDGDAAIRGMNRAKRGFAGMAQGAAQARRGVANLQKGFAGTRMATIAVAGGAAAAVKKFTDFERQFGAVKSVLGEGAKGVFPALREEAMRLGSTTSFTAVQAAEAMENLVRSGMNADQVLATVGPTLAAAAADGQDLATAADIVAGNLKRFGLDAGQAARVADTLAFVSAKTNTNMAGLEEGLKFAAPVANTLRISLEDTAATLGLFADVGLKGTLAGTGFKNSLLKIAKEAKNGKVKVGKLTAEIVNNVDAQGNVIGLNLPKTMTNIVRTLSNIKDPLARTAAGMKLLGLRGIGAATAFEAMTAEKADVLFKGLQKSSKGSADAMAKMRLDNIHGDFVRLTSAVEGFSIKIGQVVSPTVRRFAVGAQAFFGDVAQAFTVLSKGGTKDLAKLNAASVEFAQGVIEGWTEAKEIVGFFFGVVKGVVTFVRTAITPSTGLGPQGPAVKGAVKFAIKLGAVALGLKTVTSLTMRLGRVAVGSFQLIGGVLKSTKSAVTGTVGFLTKRLPALGRVLPRGLSKLTGAVSAAEKITAQPVRVVNFDEAGFGGMGTGTGAAAGTAASAVPRKTFGQLSKLGKVAHVATGAIGSMAAAFAGWQIGRAIDETTGLSDKIADFATSLDVRKQLEMEAVRRDVRAGSTRRVGQNAEALAKKWLAFSQRGVKVQADRGQQKIRVTRSLAIRKIRERFRGELSREQIDNLIRSQKDLLDKIPTVLELANRPVKVQIDGREVARTVSTTADSNRSRGLRGARPRKGEVIPAVGSPRSRRR